MRCLKFERKFSTTRENIIHRKFKVLMSASLKFLTRWTKIHIQRQTMEYPRSIYCNTYSIYLYCACINIYVSAFSIPLFQRSELPQFSKHAETIEVILVEWVIYWSFPPFMHLLDSVILPLKPEVVYLPKYVWMDNTYMTLW